MANKFLDTIRSIRNKFITHEHLFVIGDRVIYPGHGTGTIVAYETYKHIDLYKIEIDISKVKILVPMDRMIRNGAVLIKSKG